MVKLKLLYAQERISVYTSDWPANFNDLVPKLCLGSQDITLFWTNQFSRDIRHVGILGLQK